MNRTSPYTTPVTLNSFQGPSLGWHRSVAKGANVTAALSTLDTGNAAGWMLKQVQHDGLLREATA